MGLPKDKKSLKQASKVQLCLENKSPVRAWAIPYPTWLLVLSGLLATTLFCGASCCAILQFPFAALSRGALTDVWFKRDDDTSHVVTACSITRCVRSQTTIQELFRQKLENEFSMKFSFCHTLIKPQRTKKFRQ